VTSTGGWRALQFCAIAEPHVLSMHVSVSIQEVAALAALRPANAGLLPQIASITFD
jgi:hypothetical protein